MVQVYEEPISRRHYAPYFSVAFLYRPFCVGRAQHEDAHPSLPIPSFTHVLHAPRQRIISLVYSDRCSDSLAPGAPFPLAAAFQKVTLAESTTL